jgi:YbbR domain-containing protein
VREWIRSLFADPLAKLTSLILATGLWLYVQSDQVHETRITASVEWSLPSGRITTEPLPTTVALNIRGTHAATRRAAEGEVRLSVDLSGLPLGSSRVDLSTIPPQGLSGGIEVVGPMPREVSFVLDELSTRKVKVEPAEVGDPAPGFSVDEVSLEPPVVQISGARSVVGNVRSLSTQPIDVSGLSADATVQVDLDLPRGVFLADGEVNPAAHVHVQPALERVTFPSVPVYVWRHPEWRSAVDTVEVVLEGPARELEDVRPEQVVGFVHLPDAPTRTEYEAAFGPQEGVRLSILRPSEDRVKVVRVSPSRIAVVKP